MTVLLIIAFTLYVIHGLVWPYSLPPTRQQPEPTDPERGFLHLHELEMP